MIGGSLRVFTAPRQAGAPACCSRIRATGVVCLWIVEIGQVSGIGHDPLFREGQFRAIASAALRRLSMSSAPPITSTGLRWIERGRIAALDWFTAVAADPLRVACNHPAEKLTRSGSLVLSLKSACRLQATADASIPACSVQDCGISGAAHRIAASGCQRCSRAAIQDDAGKQVRSIRLQGAARHGSLRHADDRNMLQARDCGTALHIGDVWSGPGARR